MREPLSMLRPGGPGLSKDKCQMSPVSSDLRSYALYYICQLSLAFVSFLCHSHCAQVSLACPAGLYHIFTVIWVLSSNQVPI